MLISEIYESRQGEGVLTGTPSVFVRTSGCNLRCGFCDTPFTSWNPEGAQKAIAQIVHDAERYEAEHVVITGGEPMLQKEIVPLTRSFHEAGYHITIETAGTIDKEVICDLMSISPKLSNSTPTVERAGEWAQKHEATRHRPQVIDAMLARYEYQLKYVVGNREDLEEVDLHLKSLTTFDSSRVLVMPEGVILSELVEKQAWLEPLCETKGYRFCPRKHIEWYGNKRGT